jgi:hypothetical protein
LKTAKEGKGNSCRRGWSLSRSDGDQSSGQIMLLSAGDGGGAVSPEAKKHRRNAVARAAGFHLQEQMKEGKRDS